MKNIKFEVSVARQKTTIFPRVVRDDGLCKVAFLRSQWEKESPAILSKVLFRYLT